jgi:hypothetical protein
MLLEFLDRVPKLLSLIQELRMIILRFVLAESVSSGLGPNGDWV